MNRSILSGVPSPYVDLIRLRNIECAELRRQNAELRRQLERLTVEVGGFVPAGLLPIPPAFRPSTPNPQPSREVRRP